MADKMKIKFAGRDFSVIDLNMPLSLDTEVYPGDPKPRKEVFSSINESGFEHYLYTIGDHSFHPHADAPKHQNKSLQHLGSEIFGIEYHFNKAVLLDLTDSVDAKLVSGVKLLIKVSKSHLENFSEKLKSCQALVIRTGYDLWIEANKPHHPETIPYLDKDAAEFIASLPNIKVIAIDSISVDPAGPDHTSHILLKDKMIVEGLVHLHKISLNKAFILQTAPLRITGSTGCPVLAYAFLES